MDKHINKDDKLKLIILFLVVGILSLIIYMTINFNKSYSKNVNVSGGSYNYTSDTMKLNSHNIELNKTTQLEGMITEIEFIKGKILILQENIQDLSLNEIKLLDYDNEGDSEVIVSSTIDRYISNGIKVSPLKNSFVYNVVDSKTGNSTSYIYDLNDKSTVYIGENLRILAWLPDGSGLLVLNKDNIIYYDIDENKSYIVKSIDSDVFFKDIKFSGDGVRAFISIEKNIGRKGVNQLLVYDQKTKKSKVLLDTVTTSGSEIVDFEIIDKDNIIINETVYGIKTIYIYNLPSYTLKKIEKSEEITSIFLNEGKDKLVIVRTNTHFDNVLELFDIRSLNGKVEILQTGKTNYFHGYIENLVIEDEKLLYSNYDFYTNQEMVYIYDITT